MSADTIAEHVLASRWRSSAGCRWRSGIRRSTSGRRTRSAPRPVGRSPARSARRRAWRHRHAVAQRMTALGRAGHRHPPRARPAPAPEGVRGVDPERRCAIAAARPTWSSSPRRTRATRAADRRGGAGVMKPRCDPRQRQPRRAGGRVGADGRARRNADRRRGARRLRARAAAAGQPALDAAQTSSSRRTRPASDRITGTRRRPVRRQPAPVRKPASRS